MAINKFKVCPGCGEHNPPALLECKKCEADLTGVKVVDDAFLAATSDGTQTDAPKPDPDLLIKLCDCGTKNPPQSRKCVSCGEDLSDVRATHSASDVASCSFLVKLHAIDASFSFAMTNPVTVIGRDGEMGSYLKEKSYVSRKQAKLTIVNGEVYIEDLSATNHTFVNNVQIKSDAPTLLKNGDEVGLGGKLIDGERQTQAAYFVVEVSL